MLTAALTMYETDIGQKSGEAEAGFIVQRLKGWHREYRHQTKWLMSRLMGAAED